MNIKMKLTAASISMHLKPPPPGIKQSIIYDTEVPGFAVYRTSNAPGSFYIQYRVRGRARKKVIGRINEVDVHEARTKAGRIKFLAREGRDYVEETRIETEAGITLVEAYDFYMERMNKKESSPNTIQNYKQIWRCSLQGFSNRELRSITKRELVAWHKNWECRGATAANHGRSLFRAIYNHALKISDGLPANPAYAVDKSREKARRPRLEWEKLPSWWDKVENLRNPVRTGYWKFLLFSGLRRTDCATIKWEEVGQHSVLRPAPKGGAEKAFYLPLSHDLRTILNEMKKIQEILYPDNPFVFPGNCSSGRMSNVKDPSLKGVSPHMLRRTFASACLEAGVDIYTTKKLLNHVPNNKDVTSYYAQPSQDFLEKEMNRVATYIRDKINPTDRDCRLV